MQDKVWLTKKAWADNSIKSGANSLVLVLWAFAIIWNVVSLVVWLQIPELLNRAGRDPVIYVVFLFPLTGIYLVFYALKASRERYRFGQTPLVLDPFPGSIAGHLGGGIETNIPYTGQIKNQITAQCIYSYVTGTGKNRSRSESVRWQNRGSCHLDQSACGTLFKFRFDLPDDLPESEIDRSTKNYHFWRILLEAEAPAGKLSRYFIVPVYKTAQRSQFLRAATEDHHSTLAEAEAGINLVADIRPLHNGIEVWYAPFQRPAQGISMLLFGLFFSGGGLFAGYLGAPLFFPIVFSIVGGFILLAGLHYLGKALLVRVTTEGIETKRFLFGISISGKRIDNENFASFDIRQKGSMQSGGKTTILYNLIALSRDGQEITVAERHTSRPEIALMAEKFNAALD